jgi:Protein of unknown function (DUF2752)
MRQRLNPHGNGAGPPGPYSRGGRREPGWRGLRGWALAGAAGLAAFAALHAWQPGQGPGFVWCPLRRFAGLPCPACGLTRAFAHLAKGEWSAAVRDHPLAPALAAEIGLAWALWGGAAARLLRVPTIARPELAALGHLAVLVAVWLGRVATGTLPW